MTKVNFFDDLKIIKCLLECSELVFCEDIYLSQIKKKKSCNMQVITGVSHTQINIEFIFSTTKYLWS